MDFFSSLASGPLLIVKLIAAVGGFVVGYLLSGPFWRGFWRVVLRKPIPGPLVPVMKLCTGLVLAAALYSFVALGGGGWGFGGGGAGPGPGGGKTGDGKGTGSPVPGDPKSKNNSDNPAAKTKGREILVIELLGADRFSNDGKNYLLDRKEPGVTIEHVEDAFKKRPDKIELHVYYGPKSVGEHHPTAAALRDLANKYHIPAVKEVEKAK